jgi:deoxyribose-phosphate aldolase
MRVEKYIESTLLKPQATEDNILDLCQDAQHYEFAAVCVNPVYVKTAKSFLCGEFVRVCTVVGFPLGANRTDTKRYEANSALDNGANDIDVVMNIGWLKNGKYRDVETELRHITDLCEEGNIVSKVIIETDMLSKREQGIACSLIANAGATFVKNATGFIPKKASTHLEDTYNLLHYTKNTNLKIKLAGGINEYDYVVKLINAGANRIGASAAVRIMKEQEEWYKNRKEGSDEHGGTVREEGSED